MTSANPPLRPASTPGLGVLDDHGPLRNRAQSAGGFQQDGWVGLAGQPEGLGDHAVDADGKEVAESGRLQDVFAVAARRVNGRRNPGFGQLADESDRRLEYGHADVQPLEEDLLLAVAEAAHRVIGAVGRVPLRQRNSARRQEIDHAVIAGFAVHEVPVVVVGERRVVLVVARGPPFEKVVEHGGPRRRVNGRGVGNHAVEVEDDGVVQARVDGDQTRSS